MIRSLIAVLLFASRAFAAEPLSPRSKRCPLRDGAAHITRHSIQLFLRDDRSHLDGRNFRKGCSSASVSACVFVLISIVLVGNALGRIDPEPEKVVDSLVTALGDPDEDVRQAAESALPKVGKTAVPALIKAMNNDKANLRHTAIRTAANGASGLPAGGRTGRMRSRAMLSGSRTRATSWPEEAWKAPAWAWTMESRCAWGCRPARRSS